MDRLDVALAVDRGLGGEHADLAQTRRLHGCARLGRNNAKHRHGRLLLQDRQRRRRRRVASHHDQLGTPLDEDAGQLAPVGNQFVLRPRPVREAPGIAEVDDIFVRQTHERRVQDG